MHAVKGLCCQCAALCGVFVLVCVCFSLVFASAISGTGESAELK